MNGSLETPERLLTPREEALLLPPHHLITANWDWTSTSRCSEDPNYLEERMMRCPVIWEIDDFHILLRHHFCWWSKDEQLQLLPRILIPKGRRSDASSFTITSFSKEFIFMRLLPTTSTAIQSWRIIRQTRDQKNHRSDIGLMNLKKNRRGFSFELENDRRQQLPCNTNKLSPKALHSLEWANNWKWINGH